MPIFFLLILGFIAFAVINGSKSAQKTRDAFATSALTLGLQHKPGTGPFGHNRLSGKLNGYPVHVRTFTRSSGKNSKTYMRYQVMMPSLGLGLVLSQEGFFSRIASALGSQDIEVGDPIFDPLFQVRGKDERDVTHFLTRERREFLVDAIQAMPSLRITDTEVHYERRGAERDSDQIVRTVQRMIRVARILAPDGTIADYARDKKARKRSYTGSKDSAVLEGYLPADAAAASAAASAVVTPLFIPRDEAGAPDARILHEDTPAKRAAAARAGRSRPDPSDDVAEESEVSPANDISAKPTVPSVSAVEDVTPPQPSSLPTEEPAEYESLTPERAKYEAPVYETPVYESLETESLLDSDDNESSVEPTSEAEQVDRVAVAADASLSGLCQELFGTSRPSYETKELFESKHAGQTVTFEAVVDRADSYRSDSKLGDGPGTKVSVDLVGLDSEVYTGRDVHALIGLPSEVLDELKAARGETVQVTGTLHGCDAFLRVLVLTDGSIQV
tara:strand:+ start:10911 stop:12419 length:1509 start_codon:yes stop_codon:yes gene_type:complete